MKTQTAAILIGGVLVAAVAVGTLGPAFAQSGGPFGGWGMGGMMGGPAGRMMNGSAANGMMGGWGTIALPEGRSATLDEVRQGVEQVLSRAGLGSLMVMEVMEFEDAFYAIAAERDSGTAAVEVLVDKTSGRVFPEYGPAMMWNTAYGHMGSNGWMGGGLMGTTTGMMTGQCQGGAPASQAEAVTTPEEARERAQCWLDANQSVTVADDPVAFPGYYTLHTVRDGRTTGMLSVRATTGQVWYHDWHGTLIAESQFER